MKNLLTVSCLSFLLSAFFLLNSVSSVHAQSSNTCATDLNGDHMVDLQDYSILVSDFLKMPPSNPRTDINRDGNVDLIDYSLFAASFLKPCNPQASPTLVVQASPTTARPTNTPASPTSPANPTATTQPMDSEFSAAYGIWNPSDPKFATAGPQKYPTCTKAFHDSFRVRATDGKWYPTWHPPVSTDPSTGVKCTFGHEHGRDPSKSALWSMIQENYYFDANKNGAMDTNEKAEAGVPFGYANEQLDLYFESKNIASMRHEDHVGNKIEYANGEADTDGGSFGNSTTGGIVIPIIRPNNGFKWTDSGAKCYYFTKMHQGVHSPDALGNNLHEVIFFADCKGPSAAYDQKAAVTQMAMFGAPGEFTNLCDPAGDRTTPVILGKDSMNQFWPGTRSNGSRSIIQRACVEQYFLVPSGQFSMNMYEAWITSLSIRTASGQTLMSGVNLTLDVEDSIRYYDPNKASKIGYNSDLCYEVLPNGNKARGGSCDGMTNYGNIKGITWNDTRSSFKGLHRGNYYQGPTMNNAGGTQFVYTDPMGGNAQATPFTGSVRQMISTKNVNYLNLGPIDPRQVDLVNDSGEDTVHAPN